ncbi:MAG TPA: histidine kinase dimerization/phospho-acceptor domain-containing protein, partial [Hyphomicrobiaceae bacterium]|nr:histidine kinase dimerization/phospho-acceptor domain-containing protein [Hyphomicrobiaceae bacterium]
DRLSLAINAMLGRIEQLMSALKEVSDNIAHDLKTPLNRLRSRAEAALADPAGDPARKEGLEHVLEDADGVIATFDALLLIARIEAGSVAETFQS